MQVVALLASSYVVPSLIAELVQADNEGHMQVQDNGDHKLQVEDGDVLGASLIVGLDGEGDLAGYMLEVFEEEVVLLEEDL